LLAQPATKGGHRPPFVLLLAYDFNQASDGSDERSDSEDDGGELLEDFNNHVAPVVKLEGLSFPTACK
jgi:hypothetical protein